MVTFRILFVCALLSVTSWSQAQQWVKVWSDEFNKPGLPDTSKWSNEVGRIRNNELQYYTYRRIENTHIDDTTLVIESRKENYMGSAYTSASIASQFKGDWLYGRIEVRAKIPTGRGSWPAIWMLPSDNIYGGWPYSGEIDIMENVGYEPDNIYATAHFYGTNGSGHQSDGNHVTRAQPYDTFYTYTIEWSPDKIDWYIDDSKVHTYNRATGSDYRLWPFNERFYLILNLAIGGDWGGIQGIDATIFPLKYYIDYVRVYKWQTDAGPYTLTIEPSAGGTVEVSPQQTLYDAGYEIELTAIPNDGYYFGGFLYTGNANPIKLQMTEDKTIIPVFYKTGEFIKNGTFDRSIFGWNNIYVFDPANEAAKASWQDGMYVFQVTDPATDWWHLGDQWLGLSAKQGKTYRISFDAWADAINKIGLSFSKNHDDYALYYEDPEISITLNRKTYIREFTFNSPSDNNCRLYFGMGRFNSKVYLDNVSMTEVNATTAKDIEDNAEPAVKVYSESLTCRIQIVLNVLHPGKVKLSICNITGNLVETIYTGYLSAGSHEIQAEPDPTRVPAGIYLLCYETNYSQSCTKFPVYR